MGDEADYHATGPGADGWAPDEEFEDDVLMTPSGPVSQREIDDLDSAEHSLGAPLPRAPREAIRRTIQSADRDMRICVHELARALEQYARKEYVPLYAGGAEFETAAIDMAEFILAERCSLKGR